VSCLHPQKMTSHSLNGEIWTVRQHQNNRIIAITSNLNGTCTSKLNYTAVPVQFQFSTQQIKPEEQKFYITQPHTSLSLTSISYLSDTYVGYSPFGSRVKPTADDSSLLLLMSPAMGHWGTCPAPTPPHRTGFS